MGLLGDLRPGISVQTSNHPNSQSLNEISENENGLWDRDKDDDGIQYDDTVHLPWDSDAADPESPVLPTEIHGTPELKARLHQLCEEYKDIFATSVSAEPALLPPLELKVEEDKWFENKQNRLPPRSQSNARNAEVQRQLNKMIANNVIKPSEAPAWSQVMLTPKLVEGKSVKTWRFCIDHRQLNSISQGRGWPLPNIKQMFQRLGAEKPSYFGVIDLTQGYFQAPLSKASTMFTAFITAMGLFEWNRVPMGLKGAPSYFQQMMVTFVLAGIIYRICEVYLDDIVIHGKTEDEFVTNLRTVFDRFRKFNLKANPAKTRLGMMKVEYVGHVMDRQGLSFSEKKKEGVADFPKPENAKQLKSFLGLANYFRDHVDKHSMLVKPLGDMLENYDKKSARSKKLHWTTIQTEAFEAIKKAIGDCPELFFMDDTSPVFLHTDASDYGIGAYLFQVKEGKEYPIAFVSKTLAREQLRWSTPEKEAYAIYFAMTKLEYLLRDRHFTLRTDHKNLIYINDSGSPKVIRWKLALLEYDYDIEHIEGVKNIVADHMSRLCYLTEEDLDILEELNLLDEDRIPLDLCTDSEASVSRTQYRILSKVHNSQVGHHGVERTLDKLKQAEHGWPYMRNHVAEFVRECPCCQKMSYLKTPIHTHGFTTAAYRPMERLNWDTIGPLPEDELGNKHIIVIIDCFTRFVELYAVRSVKAEVAAQALRAHMGRYGNASQILSDGGSQYVNTIISELLKLANIESIKAMAYSKEENSVVERANKEVMRHLRAMLFDANITDDWHKHLPMVQRIMNSTVHRSIGVAPFQLLFGNSIDLNGNMFTAPTAENDQTIELSEYSANMLSMQAKLIKVAEDTQRVKDELHMGSMGPYRHAEYEINSYVLVDYPESRHHKGPPSKFHANREGPFRVMKFVGAKYTLLDLNSNAVREVHIKRLHPFKYNPVETDPVEVAMKDKHYFIVEAILDHKGHPARYGQMNFLIRYAGYEPEWQRWNADLKKTSQILI